jgi:predicted permease
MGSRLHEIMLRVKALGLKRRLDRELAEELEFHQAMMREKLGREGVAPEEARIAARRTFGDPRRWQERLRELWQFRRLEDLLRDAGFALRLLRRSPTFTAVALGTLTLSVGATIAVFSLIDGLLLRPLPVPHADELVVLSYNSTDNPTLNYGFAEPLIRGLEKRRDIFPGGVAGYSGSDMQVRGGSGNVNIPGALVTGQFFSTLEVPPLVGRWLTPEDDQKGGGPGGYAAVISEDFWQKWFGRAPDVVGRTLTIANVPFTVVGVMPRSFFGADPTARPRIYVSLWAEPVIDAPYNNIESGIHYWWLRIIGRWMRGAPIEQVNTALAANSSTLLRASVSDADWLKDAQKNHFRFGAEPGSRGWSWLRREFSKPLIAVFILCAAMLLLACLNLASLLLARAAARERELATRLAIGASRPRLIQQLLVESLMLASQGTAMGVAASPLVSRALTALLLGDNADTSLGTTFGASADWRMVLFAVAVAGMAALLIGLIPALRATGSSLSEQMKEGARASQRHARVLPATLMGLEVALALMLVVGAGLLTESVIRLYRTGLGFEPKGMVNIYLQMGKQPRSGDALLQWYREYAEGLESKPGIESVSYESIEPLMGSSVTYGLRTPVHSTEEKIYMDTVGPRYFATMRIPMLAGRDFRWNDSGKNEQVIILNQSAARLLFPGQNAVGQQVTGWGKKSSRVIAVVGDVHYLSVDQAAPPGAYVPITQNNDDDEKPSYMAVVRASGPATPLAAAARELAARMSPEIPAPVMTTMSSDLDQSISSQRMMAILSAFFAACALLVTAIGLYGTLAYATARRTTEIGIRMALGAQRTQVIGLVFRGNAIVAACGAVAGLAAALLASRALESFLYGTSVRDPWVLAGSVVALALVASAASLIPAIRAAWIEPMSAIRCE